MPGWLAKGASWAISRHPRVDRALRMRITANTAFSAGAAPLQNIFAELDGRSIHFFQNPARRQQARSLCRLLLWLIGIRGVRAVRLVYIGVSYREVFHDSSDRRYRPRFRS